MKVLSIDAWGNEDGTWEWNNWHTVGNITKDDFESLKTDKDYRHWLKRNGYINTTNARKCTIEDDQYNIVICDAKDMRPIFAIEYGPEY